MRRVTPFLLIFAIASSAFAQNTDEARTHFQRGVQFFKEGDYRGALIEFKRTYEIAPNYKVLYNLGQTSLELQDYAAALTAFRRYVDEGGKEVPKDRRQQVDAEIKKLEGRVARVNVKTNVEGADVLVDDVVVGKTPLSSPIIVSAGRRKIAVAKAGSPPQSRAIDVAGGDETTVDIEITQQTTTTIIQQPNNEGGSTPVIVTNPTTRMESPGGPNPVTWGAIITTGVLGVATIVVGSVAVVSKGQYDDALNTPNNATKIADARNQTKSLALVTDVLGIATIVSLGTSIVFALTLKNPPRLVQNVSIGPTGGFIRGTF